jgi:hypothetical protein
MAFEGSKPDFDRSPRVSAIAAICTASNPLTANLKRRPYPIGPIWWIVPPIAPKDGFRYLEDFFVASDEENKLTIFGLRKCPCDRRVEKAGTGRCYPLRERCYPVRRDGTHFDDRRIRRKSGYCAGFRICPDRRRGIVVRYHAHHEVGTARGFARAFPYCCPRFHEPLGMSEVPEGAIQALRDQSEDRFKRLR